MPYADWYYSGRSLGLSPEFEFFDVVCSTFNFPRFSSAKAGDQFQKTEGGRSQFIRDFLASYSPDVRGNSESV